jgi:hypothetical protein
MDRQNEVRDVSKVGLPPSTITSPLKIYENPSRWQMLTTSWIAIASPKPALGKSSSFQLPLFPSPTTLQIYKLIIEYKDYHFRNRKAMAITFVMLKALSKRNISLLL